MRAASPLLAYLLCAAVAAPSAGASATDRIHLVVVNDSPTDIVVTSQSATASQSFSVSSDCGDHIPFTVEAGGPPAEPCSIVMESGFDSFATWEFGGTYGGQPFTFTASLEDPEVEKVSLCWMLFGGPTNDCGDKPPASDATLGSCSGACPVEVSTSEPSLSDSGDGEYDLTWLAAGSGASLVVRPSATVSGGQAQVPARCNRSAGCRGTLELDARLSGAAASRPELRRIGSTRYRIPKGRSVVRVPLRRAARQHLGSHEALRVRATVRPRGKNGRPLPSRYPLVLRP